MSDVEDYEFEYSDAENEEAPADGDEESNIAVRIENLYYNSKGFVTTDVVEAKKGFEEVLAMAESGGKAYTEWGYKATKQLVKLCFRMRHLADMLQWYQTLLVRINSGDVTRNRAEKVRGWCAGAWRALETSGR